MVEREKKDMANSTEIYPIIIANPIFRNMHKELVYNVGRYMETEGNEKTLLILGLSPIASPYADSKQWFLETIGLDGKIIAIDYNVKVVAKAMAYLSEKGFFEKGAYMPKVVVNSEDSIDFLLENGFGNFLSANDIRIEDVVDISTSKINPADLAGGTILSAEGNLNHGINLTDNSVDCIDATLTLHHVAAYRQQLTSVLKEVYRVLKPGGMFHYGDAFVDMRASEAKINRIMNEMTHLTGLDMVLYDYRDTEWKVYAEYSASRNYDEVPELRLTDDKLTTEKPVIEVTPEAIIRIPVVGSLDDYISKLDELGYVQREIKEGYLEIPIIDPEVESQHIHNVFDFEDLVRELKKGLYATTNFSAEQIDEAIRRGDEERDIALKGIVEYFCPKEFLIDLLKEVGFERLSVELPNKEANYPVDVGAILAYKPS